LLPIQADQTATTQKAAATGIDSKIIRAGASIAEPVLVSALKGQPARVGWRLKRLKVSDIWHAGGASQPDHLVVLVENVVHLVISWPSVSSPSSATGPCWPDKF
jgi:hypothetical protein